MKESQHANFGAIQAIFLQLSWSQHKLAHSCQGRGQRSNGAINRNIQHFKFGYSLSNSGRVIPKRRYEMTEREREREIISFSRPTCLHHIFLQTYVPASYLSPDLRACIISFSRPTCLHHIFLQTYVPASYLSPDLRACIISFSRPTCLHHIFLQTYVPASYLSSSTQNVCNMFFFRPGP